jgi:predicted DNA-binding transcriptional regulator AlpA
MSRRKIAAQQDDGGPYLITYEDLVSRTNISRRTWERHVNTDTVPGVVKIGHSVRFNWPAVKAWLDRGGNG